MAKIRLACAVISPRAFPLMKRPFETAARKEKTHAQSVEPVADRWRSDAGRGGTRAVDVHRGCRHADGAAANAGRSPTAAARLLSAARLSAPSLSAPRLSSKSRRVIRRRQWPTHLRLRPRSIMRMPRRLTWHGQGPTITDRPTGAATDRVGATAIGAAGTAKTIPLSLLACGLEKGVARGMGRLQRAFDRNQGVCLAIAYPFKRFH